VLAQQALTATPAVGTGRLTLGIGLSHKIVIEDMYGYSFDRPARHMREYLSVLLPLLDGSPASADGSTVSASRTARSRAGPGLDQLTGGQPHLLPAGPFLRGGPANQDQTKSQRPQASPDRTRRPQTLEPLSPAATGRSQPRDRQHRVDGRSTSSQRESPSRVTPAHPARREP
jgi:hypothetical protein